MPDIIGQSLGRYHILEQLGEGGMATVYKAFDTRLERDVAVKIIRTERLTIETMPIALKRFEREAKALGKLTHPNVVPVSDYGEYEGKPYLVMPYLPGGTLKQKLGRQIPWQEAVQLLLPIAEALDYAHSQNMIHRDVKPSNILLTQRGQPMLTDFGIAKILDVEETVELTGTSTTVGTPEYMAPEQVTSKTADHRADIYALGVVLYEMVTGRKPFIADTPMAVLIKHATAPLPRPKQFAPDLPEGVEKVLLKALAKNPADRYTSMAEMGDALEKIMSGQAKIPAARGKAERLETQKVEAENVSERKARKQSQRLLVTQKTNEIFESGKTVYPGSISQRQSILTWSIIGIIAFCVIVSGVVGISYVTNLINVPATEQPITEQPLNEQPIKETPGAIIPVSFECTDALGCVDIAPDEPIHIAYALVVSGPDETLGIDSRTGVEVAIALKGQVLGHDIQLTGEDDGCSAEGGQAAGAKLADDASIVTVIGTSCSSAARTAAPLLSQTGLVLISPSNTAPDLTRPGDPNNHPGYFRTSFNDEVQGAAAARFAYEVLGVRKAATIHDGSLYSESLQAVFAEAFKELGGEVTAQEPIMDTTDFRSLLTSIASGNPGFIYFPVFVEQGSSIINQARQTPGLENAQLMGADGIFSPDVVNRTGDAIEGVFVSSADLSAFSPEYERVFLPKYKEIAGTEPISLFHAHAFDAANMLFAAIEKVSLWEPDGTLHIPRQALRDALYATRDFKGLTGNLTCSPTGDCADPKIAVYEYHAGEYPPERIWP